MLAQVAGYETFLVNLKKGYQTTENGLNTLHEMKGGTFDLHTAYFSSLQQVNPVVQSNSKGKAIAGMQQQISRVLRVRSNWQQQQKNTFNRRRNQLHPTGLSKLDEKMPAGYE